MAVTTLQRALCGVKSPIFSLQTREGIRENGKILMPFSSCLGTLLEGTGLWICHCRARYGRKLGSVRPVSAGTMLHSHKGEEKGKCVISHAHVSIKSRLHFKKNDIFKKTVFQGWENRVRDELCWKTHLFGICNTLEIATLVENSNNHESEELGMSFRHEVALTSFDRRFS